MSLLNLDYQLFLAINSLATQWKILDWLGIFCAKYLIFVILGAAFGWWVSLAKTRASHDWPLEGKKKWLVFGNLALSVIFSFLANQLVALIHFRGRPFLNVHIHQLVNPLSEKSFPSDHAAVVFALALTVYFYQKKLGAWLIFLSCLVGIARIFAGVHYPLDVVGGMVVGLGVAGVMKIILKIKDQKPKTQKIH